MEIKDASGNIILDTDAIDEQWYQYPITEELYRIGNRFYIVYTDEDRPMTMAEEIPPDQAALWIAINQGLPPQLRKYLQAAQMNMIKADREGVLG